MEDFVEENGLAGEMRYTQDKMMREKCDCSIKQKPGFSLQVFFKIDSFMNSRSEEGFQYL